MCVALTVELPVEIYQQLQQMASTARLTPEEWILIVLRRQLSVRDPQLRRDFGAISLGSPTGADSDQIQPQPTLKPLPVLDGSIPDNWKDSIYA